MLKIENRRILTGLCIALFNLLIIYCSLLEIYTYHFTKGVFVFYMLPDWVLVLNILLGIIGTCIGGYIIYNKKKPLNWRTFIAIIFIIFLLFESLLLSLLD